VTMTLTAGQRVAVSLIYRPATHCSMCRGKGLGTGAVDVDVDLAGAARASDPDMTGDSALLPSGCDCGHGRRGKFVERAFTVDIDSSEASKMTGTSGGIAADPGDSGSSKRECLKYQIVSRTCASLFCASSPPGQCTQLIFHQNRLTQLCTRHTIRTTYTMHHTNTNQFATPLHSYTSHTHTHTHTHTQPLPHPYVTSVVDLGSCSVGDYKVGHLRLTNLSDIKAVVSPDITSDSLSVPNGDRYGTLQHPIRSIQTTCHAMPCHRRSWHLHAPVRTTHHDPPHTTPLNTLHRHYHSTSSGSLRFLHGARAHSKSTMWLATSIQATVASSHSLTCTMLIPLPAPS
jgi:hypothetical protein